MKFIIATILIALLSFAVGLFQIFPWWIFVVLAFIVAIAIPQKPWKAFLSGFVALFLLWAVMAFMLDSANEHLLSTKVAQILKVGNSYVVILITGIIGGLVAGLGALSGSYIRRTP